MSKLVQHRGGNSADHAGYVGAPREVTVNTDAWSLRVHDGVTPGGCPLRGEFNVRDYGAHPDATATVNTLAFQKCIDAAMEQKKGVFVPAGIYHLTPWSPTDPNVLVLGYCEYDPAFPPQKAGPAKSSTHPTGYLEAPLFNSFEIRGECFSQRSVGSDGTDIYNRGTVLKFDGNLTDKIALFTGAWERQVVIRDMTIIGVSSTVSLGTDLDPAGNATFNTPATGAIAVRSSIGTSSLVMRNVAIKQWAKGIGIGDNATNTEDAHGDFNLLENVHIDQCDTGIHIGAQNAYITTIIHPSISARICLRNDKGIIASFAGQTLRPSPKVTILGGFMAPLTAFNGLKVEGTVSSVAGATVTPANLTKLFKVHQQTTPTTGPATTADIKPGMICVIEGDSQLNPAPPEWGVIRKVRSVAGAVVTLDATLNSAQIPADAKVVFGWPAIAFYGDNFTVHGTHLEETSGQSQGYGPMLWWIEGWRSESKFAHLHVNLFQGTNAGWTMTWNRYVPKFYQRGTQSAYATSVAFEDCTFCIQLPKFQHDNTKVTHFARNSWINQPGFIDQNGRLPDGIFCNDEQYTFKYRTPVNPSGALGDELFWHYNGKVRLFRSSIDYQCMIPMSRAMYPAASLLVSGELLLQRDGAGRTTLFTQDVPSPFGWYEIPAAGPPSSLTPGTAAATAGTQKSHQITVTDLTGIYVGRILKIAGAGNAGADLTARVTELWVADDGLSKGFYVSSPVLTTVTAAVITGVSPTLAISIGDPNAGNSQLTVFGGAGATNLQSWRRTNGVTQESAIRLLAAATQLWDVTAAKQLWRALTNLFEVPALSIIDETVVNPITYTCTQAAQRAVRLRNLETGVGAEMCNWVICGSGAGSAFGGVEAYNANHSISELRSKVSLRTRDANAAGLAIAAPHSAAQVIDFYAGQLGVVGKQLQIDAQDTLSDNTFSGALLRYQGGLRRILIGVDASGKRQLYINTLYAPTNFVGTPSSGQISLAWTASAGATSYTVSQATAVGGPYTVIDAAAVSPKVVTGLAASTAYYFKISAQNASGTSDEVRTTATTPA
jgi:hypothetical protein